jgi:uncharacterized protein (DUF305 family)
MERNLNIIFIAVTVLLLAGVGAWYFITGRQTTEKNQQQANTTSKAVTDSTAVVNDSKFAKLTGEAYDEAYIGDMLAHHEGALNMSEMVSAGTERPELLQLAQTIMQTQSQELMKMQTWQQEWGYERTMGGHGSHAGMGNEMSGDMMMMGEELTGLKGTEFDKKFLELMIEHHQQAVDMSKYADTNASHRELKDLAKAVIAAQEAEIAQMKQWQSEWGL